MDYLDPKKQSRHRIIMLVGYVVITVAIVIAAIILMYQAYGFGISQQGNVIQNGLVSISSQPVSAKISINGVNKSQTVSKLVLPSGIYNFKLTRSGYQDWQRTIEVQGGSVNHFDYPLLIPSVLKPMKLQDYTSAPLIVSESPDKRWLIVQGLNTPSFKVLDLNNPTKLATTLDLPLSIYSKVKTSENWQITEWADDNQHVVMLHTYDGKSEYILIDRQNIEQSVNLTSTLTLGDVHLSLQNKKYDQYYVYESSTSSLKTITLSSPTQTSVLERVLAYKTVSSDTVLYVTDAEAPDGKVLLKMLVGSQVYTLRNLPISSKYLIDIADYGGNQYIAVSVVTDSKIYVYKDPIGQLKSLPTHVVVPIQVMHITNPNYLSFSSVEQQFIMAENDNQFAVYDLQYRNGYKYTFKTQIDSPEVHSDWVDASHMSLVSDGKIILFDFDGNNQQPTVSASSKYPPFFSSDYRTMYYLESLNQTWSLNQVSLVAN